MVHQNKERSAEQHAPASEQDLDATRKSARRFWKEIRMSGNDAVSEKDGLTAHFDETEETASMTRRRSPVQWDTTVIGFDDRGSWYVDNTDFEPGGEAESQKLVIGHSTKYPLVSGEGGRSVSTTYRQLEDGQLEVLSVGEETTLESISAARANDMSEHLGGLANEAKMRRTLGALGSAIDVEIAGG